MDETMKQQNTGYTLASWLDEWMVTYKQCCVKEPTYKIYEFAVSLIKRQSESHLPLSKITEIDLQKILNKLYKEEYSKSTLSKCRNSLRQCYSVALRLHLINDNSSEFISLPDAPTKKVLPLTHEEQSLVENACRTDPLGHLFIFLLRTGIRRYELIHLKWKDYRADTKEISITKSKTKAGIRTVFLLDEAQKIIEEQPHINEYIFNNTRKTPLSNSALKRLYNRLRKKTGVMHLTNHVCRHTFVTRMCEKGVNPKAIAQIIGHAKTDYVMDIYAMIEKRQLRYAIYKLEEKTNTNENKHTIKIPTVLYNIAVNYAVASGMTVDTFIAKAMLNSLNMGMDAAVSMK